MLSHQSHQLPSETELFNFNFSLDFDFDLPVGVLIRMAKMNIQKLATSTIDSFSTHKNSTFFTIRESVTKLMMTLRSNVQDLRYAIEST